eukprot:gene22362-biopygen10247
MLQKCSKMLPIAALRKYASHSMCLQVFPRICDTQMPQKMSERLHVGPGIKFHRPFEIFDFLGADSDEVPTGLNIGLNWQSRVPGDAAGWQGAGGAGRLQSGSAWSWEVQQA